MSDVPSNPSAPAAAAGSSAAPVAAPSLARPVAGALVLHRVPLPPARAFASDLAASSFQLCPLPPLQVVLQPLLTPEGLEALAKECGRELDLQSTQLLGEIADDFVESVTVFAAEIAKHRGGTEITSRDVQTHLRLNWGLDLALDDEESASSSSLVAKKRARPDGDAPAPENSAQSSHHQRLMLKARLMTQLANQPK